MLKKIDVVHKVLGERVAWQPSQSEAKQYAPSNMALCKYWGKRDQELNLPATSSLSLALNDKGTTTSLALGRAKENEIYLNDHCLDPMEDDYQRITNFLALFRGKNDNTYLMKSHSNIPIASGLASSASGFAALVLALNQLYNWQLAPKELSILSRLGSGSACRSIYNGFVIWHAGHRQDGMDSFAEPIKGIWPELCLGILTISRQRKAISSRDAMQQTIKTSLFYSQWDDVVKVDLQTLTQSIAEKDFKSLGTTAEANALTMHAMMLAARPAICYFVPETLAAIQKVWQLRADDKQIFFTQDAGPNLVLLFLQHDYHLVKQTFPDIEIIKPFDIV